MTSVREADPAAFDVCGELPRGTALLEASAGTGKTFTVAAIATRLVAEGVCELPALMLVTFSRAATRELRERVRDQLASAHRALAQRARARDGDDELVTFLAGGDDAEVARRRTRLGKALSAFDGATIATTHGFCRQMLAELGVAGGTDPGLTFVERIDDLVDEVVAERYLSRFAPACSRPPPIDFAGARLIGAAAVNDRHADLAPRQAGARTTAALRVAIGSEVRAGVQRRKRARRLIDYDDLLTDLRDALADPVAGPLARQRVRERYRYVLVDEFQDTDPVQWEILRRAFLGQTNLVLIGDPKQAIYAFRGADVFAYLDAAAQATSRRTLSRNWRSDAGLLRALEAVFGGAALGDREIVVRPVRAAHEAGRLTGAPVPAPLRLRAVGRAAFGLAQHRLPSVKQVRPLVAADVAADIEQLLRCQSTIALDDHPRPLAAGDIAVLVRTNDQAGLVRDALVSAGVPAVLTGTRSVFSSPAAREWLTLLRALGQPHRAGLVRAAALSSFVGWHADRLGADDAVDVDELALRVRDWRDVLAGRGVAALLETISSSEGLPRRLLARPDGERTLTDLRHIGQALHEAAVTDQLGPAAAAEWLQRRIADAGTDASEQRSRRLDTDAAAVQVVTIHASKGLEFPLVYVPFGWDRHVRRSPDLLHLHESGRRLLDVGGADAPDYAEHRARHLDEEAGEDLRLYYVALTRAQCQVVAWWAPSYNTASSALHRLLFADRDHDGRPADKASVPDDATARAELRRWAERAQGDVSVEDVEPAPLERWEPPTLPRGDLAPATFSRSLDLAWRRTSYSALTLAAPDAAGGVSSEPEQDERRDEPPTSGPERDSGHAEHGALRQMPSPMGQLPVGAAFGTVVHRVLEAVDTGADDLAGELRRCCADVLGRRLASDLVPDELAAALLPPMRTPLGRLAGDRPLAGVAPGDRLTELEFELPLSGGDRPTEGAATLASVADLLRRHLSPGDPLGSYADMLERDLLPAPPLRGYLTGSIDAVLRVRPHGDDTRYVVVDYKTNWLGAFDADGRPSLTAWDYRPPALAAAMIEAHYPLQALLYSVALHRYLRWRQPSYDPARHLGGVLYLFLRGMCGPQAPTPGGAPAGVFAWQPPAELVVALSDLLDRGIA